MRHETPLQRRQRLHRTIASKPITVANSEELDYGDPLFQRESTNPEHDAMLRDLVDALPEPMCDVVTLRMWGRMTFDEIAYGLGLPSRGSAHAYWNRALARLRRDLIGGEDAGQGTG